MSRFGKPNTIQSAAAPPMQAPPAKQPMPPLPNKPKYGKPRGSMGTKQHGMGNPHAKGAGTMPC